MLVLKTAMPPESKWTFQREQDQFEGIPCIKQHIKPPKFSKQVPLLVARGSTNGSTRFFGCSTHGSNTAPTRLQEESRQCGLRALQRLLEELRCGGSMGCWGWLVRDPMMPSGHSNGYSDVIVMVTIVIVGLVIWWLVKLQVMIVNHNHDAEFCCVEGLCCWSAALLVAINHSHIAMWWMVHAQLGSSMCNSQLQELSDNPFEAVPGGRCHSFGDELIVPWLIQPIGSEENARKSTN